jgi:cytidylate kinase
MLIGLTGPSGSRKTAVVKRLEEAHGFTRIHAGRPVKDAVRAFGLTKAQTDGDLRDTPTMLLGGAAPRNIMEAYGDGTHEAAPNATSVVLQQRIAEHMSQGKAVVVDGVRSPVEAATIKRLGGVIVRADKGTAPDPEKPMDRRQATVKAEYTVAVRRPCVGLLPYVPCWRWGFGTDRTPWYPTMRLLRQSTPGDWSAPLQQLRDLVKNRIADPDWQLADPDWQLKESIG